MQLRFEVVFDPAAAHLEQANAVAIALDLVEVGGNGKQVSPIQPHGCVNDVADNTKGGAAQGGEPILGDGWLYPNGDQPPDYQAEHHRYKPPLGIAQSAHG